MARLVGLTTIVWWASIATAGSDLSTVFKVNEEDPAGHIPTIEQRNANPLQFGYYLQDLYTRGQLALEKKDYAKAVKYFETLTKILPDRALSFGALCQSYQHLGKLDLAAASCARAISLEGATLVDHLRFLDVTLSGKAPTKEVVADLDASIAHVREHLAAQPKDGPLPPESTRPSHPPDYQPTSEEVAADVAAAREAHRIRKAEIARRDQRSSFLVEFEITVCRLAQRLRDGKRLGECVERLRGQNVNEPIVLTYEWSKAVVQGDVAGASTLLTKAKKLGIPAATLDAMADEQAKAFAPKGFRGFVRRWGLPLFAVVTGLVLALRWFVRRRARLGKPALATPSLPADSTESAEA